MNLYEIIESVKSNKPVDKENMIYAIMALDNLWFFDKHAITNLAEAKRGVRPSILNGDPIYQEKESFRRAKQALNKDPKEWMGWDNDPKNPNYQKDREIAIKLLEKVTNSRREGKKR